MVLALTPTLAAVWLVPGFVTQDGPAHLYNARILAEDMGGDSPYATAYEVSWSPVPNWAGHMLLVALMAAGGSPWVADRLVLTLTLIGLAAAILSLRWRLRGAAGLPLAALIASLLALNVTWLLGFSSFLLGACLFPLTLGLWWTHRERPGPTSALTIAALLTVAYFAHVVSMGILVAGVLVLALWTPIGTTSRRERWVWTLAALAPVVPLGVLYRSIAGVGGPIEPLWMEFEDPTSLASWWTRLVWVDPISLASKVSAPFVERRSAGFAILAPVVWAAVGFAALVLASYRAARDQEPATSTTRTTRAWTVLAVGLVLGGVLGPDSLGERHGNYLSQRLILLGLIALVPALNLNGTHRLTRLGGLALWVAVAVQSAFVWEYALRSQRLVEELTQARTHLERGERVGVLMLDLAPRFRANPLRHAGTLLGVETGAVIWSNYEAAHYYFPVRVREDVPHPPVLAFEEVSLLDDPAAGVERRGRWERLLAMHHAEIETLVVRGTDPAGLDPITSRWFEPVAGNGSVRVFRHRDMDGSSSHRAERVARTPAASSDEPGSPR